MEQLSLDERESSERYIRQPTVHGSLLAFIQEDDVWLQKNWQDVDKPAAQRLTTDGCCTSPAFSPDGTRGAISMGLTSVGTLLESQGACWRTAARRGRARDEAESAAPL